MARTHKSERQYQGKRQELQSRIDALKAEIERLDGHHPDTITETCRYCCGAHSSSSHHNDVRGV